MANPLTGIRKKFRQVDMLSILDEALQETESILLDLIRSQLEVGESSIGIITPELKSERYARQKKVSGSKAPFGVPDLFKTGAFYDKLNVRYGVNSVLIRSSNKKSPALRNKYGNEIFELNQDNFEYYLNEVIEPLMINKINNVLQ